MIVQQINTTLNTAAPGRIAEEIGKVLLANGHTSYIGFGRKERPSESKLIKIGNNLDHLVHGAKTRLFDLHGFGSKHVTEKFVGELQKLNPDIIHLHNLHGYYLNIEVLFRYLKTTGKPVVWTMHDCWPFTGHCSYFDYVNCFKWESQCFSCPNTHAYPKSWLVDNSKANYIKKKELFTGLENLVFISPSGWLANHLKNSFLKDYPVYIIHNGVDIQAFNPIENNKLIREKYKIGHKSVLLGVASIWDRRKGLNDFLKLSKLISSNQVIVLIGLNNKQIESLPPNIIGVARTESIHELVEFYSLADIFINPTYVDNFPTTNIEALACGTPVITYNTGGSPEAIDEKTGKVVGKGDIAGLISSIKEILGKGKEYYKSECRGRAELLFNKDGRYLDYLDLYKKMLSK